VHLDGAVAPAAFAVPDQVREGANSVKVAEFETHELDQHPSALGQFRRYGRSDLRNRRAVELSPQYHRTPARIAPD
jgi:hypothetical protein